jgi:ABC-type phosphate transport system auxiliary subunit
MPHRFEKVLAILQAPTADLRELAHLAGGDPRTFYRGISLSDVDTTGQNIEGMDFSDDRLQEPDLVNAIDPTAKKFAKQTLTRIRDKKTRLRSTKTRIRDTDALISVLKSFRLNKLSGSEKADLKKRLQKHKKELKDVAKVVDRHLKKLATKKKRKVGKRKT